VRKYVPIAKKLQRNDGGVFMGGVIVVDDSSFMRKMVAQSLEEAGFKILGQAVNGSEAFEIYKKERPDFVVMDVTMRGTDGLEGASMIKQFDPTAKIVFMSLNNDPAVKEKAMALGALGFVGKNEKEQLITLLLENEGIGD